MSSENIFDPTVVKSILDKLGRDDRYTPESLATVSFDELYKRLTPKEVKTFQQLLGLKPKELGFLGPYVSIEGPPTDLVTITGQSFKREGIKEAIATKYLPKSVWEAFQRMQRAIDRDIGSRLMVESGYRSPAYQALLFLTYLERSKFDIKYVASGVALPGYSQHGDPINTAIDVINQDGIPTEEEPHLFANTKEYEWLIENAKTYNFHLSYPEGNEFGVKFEPWHWRYHSS